LVCIKADFSINYLNKKSNINIMKRNETKQTILYMEKESVRTIELVEVHNKIQIIIIFIVNILTYHLPNDIIQSQKRK
jgi:hypothetical protein